MTWHGSARRSPSSSRAAACFTLACLLGFGCESDERYCKLAQTQIVARTAAKEIDAIALGELGEPGESVLLAWSDSAGLFARVLDAQGKPLGEPSQLGERCDGGIAIASSIPSATDRGQSKLACSRRARPRDVASAGHVQVYALTTTLAAKSVQAHATLLARYEPVGTLSDGVALVSVGGERSGATALAWHDASPDMHRVWLVRAGSSARGAQAARAAPKMVSTLGRMAESPALIALRGEPVLAWSERYASERASDDGPQTVIMLQRGDAAPQVVRERAYVSALPLLAPLGNEAVLGFRDLGGGGRKVGLFLSHLERESAGASTLWRAADPVRVGRAEGMSKPVVVPCMDGLVTATPRGYSGDYFIGLNWLSPRLTRPRREQQFYEDAHAFTQAAAVCLLAREGPRARASHALIALAELPLLDRPDEPKLAGLHIAKYACE